MSQRDFRKAGACLGATMALLLGACSTQPIAQSIPDQPIQERLQARQQDRLVQDQGRVGFIENRVSDQRDRVLTKASQRFSTDPSCTYTKTGLTNSRRAITVEDCRYDLPSQQMAYAGTPIDVINYRFVDGKLLQMRLEFSRGNGVNPQVSEIRQSLSNDLQLSQALGNDSNNRWVIESDVVELSHNPENGDAALQISDAQLIDRVIALR